MKMRLLMLVTAGLLLGADAPKDDKNDVDNIQGTWKVVSAEDSGRKPPEEAIKNLKWTISKDKITYTHSDKMTEWTYKLDSTRSPKWIDLTDDRTFLGIYHLEGDNLKICFPEHRQGERSTAFESKPDSVNDVLIILEREKP